ncbi:MAG: hypothetical protein KBA60_09415 [Flavobacteriales bacterium]|nr:hypothetical protein [Flavobacteriales bacterium]MBP6642720.1 hypothetical protein [Flavobacteriales bacterium]MBP7156216.1 hypothetical protein [Flavobacteriales bacterium]HQW39986.1 hypothetical protein [Flavobacteriales bacterium]
MRPILTILFVFLVGGALHAQETIYEETRVPYKKEILGGIMLHGDGWGLQFYHAKYRTARDRRLLGFEVVSMKHPKEVKSFNPYYEDSRGYFYGKVNTLIVARPSYGRKWQITDKIRRSGVELNFIWSIGASLGLLKPVYLQIGTPDRIPYENIIVERYDPIKHDVQNIYGRASFVNGIGEIAVFPGAFGRVALDFEYSGNVTGVKGIEIGATLDAFARKVPIMYEVEGVKNKQFFFEFYVALQFGKKFTT